MRNKYNKEDIAAVFKTHFAEQSLIVMDMDKVQNSEYIETALVKIQDRILQKNDIENWVQSIPRFRDVFIYEKLEEPVRVRLKTINPSIEIIDANNWDDSKILDWLDTQDLNLNIQQGPLFKIFIFKSENSSYLACCYHHLLFDAISIQYAFASLLKGTNISFKEWIPVNENNKQIKVDEVGFELQNFVPQPIKGVDQFLYEELELPELHYKDFMAKWAEFIFFATGEDQICIGEVFSLRNTEPAAQDAIGYYVQTWPLILKSNSSIKEDIEIQRSKILKHIDKPVQSLYPTGLFDHCWVLEPEIKSEYKAIFRSRPHYLLSIVIKANNEGVSLCFVWNLNKITKLAAKEIFYSFNEFVNSKNAIKKINKESYQLKPINYIWTEKINLNPDKIAVRDSKGNKLSYKQLEDLSDSLASVLDVKIQEPVGIRTSNSVLLIVSMLAILKKRAIYVPLDPEISDERFKYIINDANINTIISDLEAVPLKTMIHPIQNKVLGVPMDLKPDLNDICYLIYTSGTTGQPKGCSVMQKNLSNLFLGTALKFDFKEDDSWILAHSYGFDFSTWEIWGALLNGASLYIPDRKDVKDSFKFYKILQKEEITILNQTPKAFENLMIVGESEAQLGKLRYLIFGGDKLNFQKIYNWQLNNTQVKAVNMYGITETTVHVTFKEVEVEEFSNIGNPLPGYALSLRNVKGNIVPDGFIGELYVEGSGVCNGYFQKEQLTAEKFDFQKNPTYRSGDLGWRMNNDFYYLGRNDRQIKIRGYRIELGEIEFLLQKEFRNLFKVLFIDNKLLIAFHTCPFDIDRSMCISLLPEYGIPSRFIQLKEIPLNINGKTDEEALKNIIYKVQKDKSNGPDDLLPYFSKVLGNNIALDRSFIENGGDSISAIRLINALRKDNFNLAIQDLFTTSSLSQLKLKKLNENSIRESWMNDPLIDTLNLENQFKIDGVFPLSESQMGILYDSLAGTEDVYMVQLTYEIGSDITVKQLRKAYLNVMYALPALQLQIRKHEDIFLWVLPKEPVIEIEQLDFSGNLNDFLASDFKKPFDFSKNLMRLSILTNEYGNSQLIWTHHHILMDGWSLGLFSKLLFESLKGNPITKQTSYLDFLYSFKDKKSSNETYWKSRLEKCSNDPLIPYLTKGGKLDNYGEFVLEINEIPLWRELPQSGLTPHNFVYSAWLAFLTAVFNKNEINIGNVISLREGNLVEEVGMFIQTLPFYMATVKDELFSDFSARVKHQLLEDIEHKELSYKTLEGINLNLDHIFVFENYPIDESVYDNSSISIGEFKERTAAKWTLICYPTQNGIKIRTLFQGDFYNSEYVGEIMRRFAEFIQNIHWDYKIGSIPKYISKAPILEGKNKPLPKIDNLFDYFTSNDGFKIISINDELTDVDIHNNTKRIAIKLSELGIENNEAVGIDLKSVSNFVIAVLSIWKVNAVPCSVDYRYPEQRKSFIWENASCRFVMVEKDGEIFIETKDYPKMMQSADASFILHTSGSTGIPKGVIQTKDCLIHLANWTATELGLSKNDRILALSSFGFDASYHEMILWLSLAATFVEMPYESRQDIQEIRKYIISQQISIAWIPARLLNSILEIDPFYFDECQFLKQIVTTGEALIIGEALSNWVKRENIRLFNFYGPTETHVVTAKVIDKNNISTIPDIGQPIHNAAIGIFNSNGEQVPRGFTGELFISGPYLANGYLKDQELDSEKFVYRNNVRWYKSGDIGWINENQNIEYLGRLDDQIKIRGYRIEPFEVESLIHKVEGVKQVAIAVDKTEETKLIAFWTGRNMSDTEFRKNCSKILPEFMIPEVQVYRDSLPRNINGKIDRNLLLENYYSSKEPISNSVPNSSASRCWKAILGHENFRKNSQFLSVGGNSIKIMRMQAWLEKNYGISCTVKELIINQTISELDDLIIEKETESNFLLPDAIPLNSLQNDLLIAEEGNYISKDSPFLLSFSCDIPKKYEINEFERAIEYVFECYPHLTYVFDNDQKRKQFVKCKNFREFIKVPLHKDSLQSAEPLLRIFQEDSKLTVQWHHIVLDAVGISMFMQTFYSLLVGEETRIKRSYKSFLQQHSIKNIAKTESSSKECIVFNKTIGPDEKKLLENLGIELKLSLSDVFLLVSHSLFGLESLIAYTDNELQCGIPGMFTFLNCSSVTEKGCILQKNVVSDKKVSMVTNFMYAPELPIDVNIESSAVKLCKYSYEFQIEVFEDKIQLQFICEFDNKSSEDKANQLFNNIDKLLVEKSFQSLFDRRINEIHFEDFDF